MSTCSTKTRLVWFAILMGIASSIINTPAWADAAVDYQNLNCVGCHGGPAPGSIKVESFPTASELAGYIDVYMPKNNPRACTGTCAQDMALYLKSFNQPPIAKAGAINYVGVVPLTVSFDRFASTDDNGIVSYEWKFGDGQTGDGSGDSRLDHTYTAAGTYTATLTVTDAQGLTSSSSINVYALMTHTPPTINTSKSSGLSGVAPVMATLDASLSTCTGGCREYQWRYDDADTEFGATINHVFNKVGTHIVELYVFDGGTDASSYSYATLTVNIAQSSNSPVANASKSANLKGAMPLNVSFDASLSNCANSCGTYAWNFGDGAVASGPGATVMHTYTKAGDFTATLTVTDKSNGKTNSTPVPVKVVPSESLTTYVQACQSQLQFQSIPDFNCYDGDLFATPADFNKNGKVRDFVGNKALNDQVDATFACRWLDGDKSNPDHPVSVEMLVHNRVNGNTCFFSAKGTVSGDSTPINPQVTSPTSPNANLFWDQPATVDDKVRCIGCHVSGPYIATPTIAPYLAKFGLLNNGHDTLSNVSIADLATPNKNVKYHVVSGKVNNVPGAFSLWDSQKQSYINPTASSCSIGCHMIGTLSPQQDIQAGPPVLLTSPSTELYEIHHYFVMKPYDNSSDYRWINVDTAGDGVEKETFEAAINATTTLVPKLFSAENTNCPQPNVPSLAEVRVAGSNNIFLIGAPNRFAFLPDRLSVFNLKQGLVCLNADQDGGGTCQDYTVSYECTDAVGNKSWVDSLKHGLKSDGDHEERPAYVCPGGATATSIKASYTEKTNGWTYSSVGPNDRLAAFSQYGLTCNNADQPDNQCSNYVLHYDNCTAPPQLQSNKTLTNVYAVGKQLTAASGSLVKGQAHNNSWNTQAWNIEPVTNTEYVRLKNPGTNVYLTVFSATEQATVGTAAANSSINQMWLIEPVTNSTDIRLKNLYSGKYLTMADPKLFQSTPDYLPIYSQSRNTGWTSQRWIIN